MRDLKKGEIAGIVVTSLTVAFGGALLLGVAALMIASCACLWPAFVNWGHDVREVGRAAREFHGR